MEGPLLASFAPAVLCPSEYVRLWEGLCSFTAENHLAPEDTLAFRNHGQCPGRSPICKTHSSLSALLFHQLLHKYSGS